jgi:hypothetical protein
LFQRLLSHIDRQSGAEAINFFSFVIYTSEPTQVDTHCNTNKYLAN